MNRHKKRCEDGGNHILFVSARSSLSHKYGGICD